MENSENGGSTPATSASQAEQMIPKSRLDEVLAERNRLREERNFSTQTVQSLTQLLQQQKAPRAPAQEHPVLKKLKEEGRTEEAAMFAQLLRENAQNRQANAALVDQTDRNAFLYKYGKKAETKLQEVERIVEAERQRGNFGVTREGAYVWLVGSERLSSEDAVPVKQAAQPQFQAATPQDDGPSSNPNEVTTLRQAGASESTEAKNRVAEIPEDFEF